MIYNINYADSNFENARSYNTKTAYSKGKVDKVLEYRFNDLDEEFKEKNKAIFSYNRGVGLWLWKPYIIRKTLQQVRDGDFVIYSDAGSFFINKVSYLTDTMDKDNIDIMVFGLPLLERQFTKKESFVLMEHLNYDLNQIMASYLIVRKSSFSVDFINEWLSYSRDERIISYKKFLPQVQEFPDYISHREDQSILSILCHIKEINSYRDPSQYGDRPWEYANKLWFYRPQLHYNSTYPRILINSRNLNHTKYYWKEILKTTLNKLGFFNEFMYFRKHQIPINNKIK